MTTKTPRSERIAKLAQHLYRHVGFTATAALEHATRLVDEDKDEEPVTPVAALVEYRK